MLLLVSALVLSLLAAGAAYRRRPRVHAACMSAAFALDLSLVLHIELTRRAVETVAAARSPLLWLHAGASAAVLLLYIGQFALARSALTGTGAGRRWHVALGLSLVTLRLLNFATSFAVSGAGARLAPAPALASSR